MIVSALLIRDLLCSRIDFPHLVSKLWFKQRPYTKNQKWVRYSNSNKNQKRTKSAWKRESKTCIFSNRPKTEKSDKKIWCASRAGACQLSTYCKLVHKLPEKSTTKIQNFKIWKSCFKTLLAKHVHANSPASTQTDLCKFLPFFQEIFKKKIFKNLHICCKACSCKISAL
jgi:hypothetical protein